MRINDTKKSKKLSWSKNLVSKWFNIKSKTQDIGLQEGNGDGRKSHINPFETTTKVEDYKIFVTTWNVGGKPPPNYLNLEDWLQTSPPADIYILGFQEIVPLNAGNVLGTEDNGPARKWVGLIRKALNNQLDLSSKYQTPPSFSDQIMDVELDFEWSKKHIRSASDFPRRSLRASRSLRVGEDAKSFQHRRLSVCDRAMSGYSNSNHRWGDALFNDENMESLKNAYYSHVPSSYERSRYCLVASKQMVGIFLMIWVQSKIKDDVKNMKVSCVGTGLMGYLGNKGSISISLKIHQTSFCFVCTHLTSGEKEGDELRRNADVMEILRKTRFPSVHNSFMENQTPETILDHDRVIWLGDLNYRIAMSYCIVKTLIEMRNWRALLEKDQLRIEQKRGRIFKGWCEGKIYFPPTYKYLDNSDQYTGAGDRHHPKEKRRTPAWCDRILWYGSGLNQLSYVRGESRFSDHRPVYAVFKADVVESITYHSSVFRKNMNCGSTRIEVEELLPQYHGRGEHSLF
ncbi:Inositol-1, 4, 5-trisphosphate 5-Phosphatase-like protein [Zostera marina]|uniref:Inositol-1, 4, 5-trisphosphate 5-Phosphatase-like protein n=1 Tax=Zostera marina TaxID=29655 RepID=A0A0K9P971_ZOSMR|nr:Inositol-1, 4, 5-trisphosphate 5-Phosphatase-like protein [Zostera marina]